MRSISLALIGTSLILCLSVLFFAYLYFNPETQANIKKWEIENIKVEHERAVEAAHGLGKRMQYFKDDRVGKCFGVLHYRVEANYERFSITEVGCTPGVEELIKQGVK